MAAGLYNFIVTEMGGLCLFCYGKEPDLQGSADFTHVELDTALIVFLFSGQDRHHVCVIVLEGRLTSRASACPRVFVRNVLYTASRFSVLCPESKPAVATASTFIFVPSPHTQ